LDDIDDFKIKLQKSPFYSQSGWQMFMRVQDDLVMYFRFLEKINFEGYWRQEILTKLEERMRAVRRGLAGFDAIGEVEYVTGHFFQDRSLAVYVLYFNRPKGIRLTGQNLIVNNKWSIDRIIGVSMHELLHSPLELDQWRTFVFDTRYLKADDYLMSVIEGQNRTLEYNSFDSFINENVTLFLDQLASEELGIAIEARTDGVG
jgi:hypothetical protein